MTRGDLICTRCARRGHVAATCTWPTRLLWREAAILEVIRSNSGVQVCDIIVALTPPQAARPYRPQGGVRVSAEQLEAMGLVSRDTSHPRSAMYYPTPEGLACEYELMRKRPTAVTRRAAMANLRAARAAQAQQRHPKMPKPPRDDDPIIRTHVPAGQWTRDASITAPRSVFDWAEVQAP